MKSSLGHHETDPDMNFRVMISNKKQLQDAHELLIMHKRFEQNAARRMFDRGGGLAHLEHRCRSFQTSNSSKNISLAHRADRISNHQGRKLRKSKCFKDNGYLAQLVAEKEISNPPDENENVESGLLDLWSNRVPNGQSNSLRLPKFRSLPPENKEIFYTHLSHISSLPRFPEIKTPIKQTAKQKVTQKKQLKQNSKRLEADHCLRAHALLRNREAFNVNTAVSSTKFGKTVKLMNFLNARELFKSVQTTDTKKDGSDLNILNLLPAENKVRPKRFRWSNFVDSGALVKDMKPSNAPKKTVSVAVMEKTASSKILPAKLNGAECKKLDVKRRVRFSEFLQEVHLYSPLTTSDTSV